MQLPSTEKSTSAAAFAAGLLLFLCAACSDTRTPYQAYVDCDADISAAVSLEMSIACVTDNQQQLLQARSQGDGAWLKHYQQSRPVISRLHEEQLQNVDDESLLLIVGHTRLGLPVAVTVSMRRIGGRWKIDHEESLTRVVLLGDGPLPRFELGPAGGEPWYPGEFTGSIARRAEGDCQLSIAHAFEVPRIQLRTNCEHFQTAGTYSVQDLLPAGSEGSESTIITLYDARRTGFSQVDGGQLTVTNREQGRISGQFTFELANVGGQLTITGSFTNLPLNL